MKRWALIACVLLMLLSLPCAHANEYMSRLVEGLQHVLGIASDGTVKAAGDNTDGQCNVEGWTDIVKVAAGFNHSVGLRADGTVVAVGQNTYGQCDVSDWQDIVDIAAYVDYTIGLKSDATLVVAGYLPKGYREDIRAWQGIKKVIADWEVYAITDEGSILSTSGEDLSAFTDVVQVIQDVDDTVVLQADGTVCEMLYGEVHQRRNMDNAIQLAFSNYLYCLKADGTVYSSAAAHPHQDWTDIVAITAHFGIRVDGSIVSILDDELAREVCSWRLFE